MALSITEFASKIKAKYPDYSDMDDTVLVNKIIDKYPEYKSTVDLGSSAPAPKTELPQFAQQAQEPQPQADAGYSGPVLPQSGSVAPSPQQQPIQPAAQIGRPPSLQQAIVPRSYGQNPQAPGAAARSISDLVSLPMRSFDAIAVGAGTLSGGGSLQQAYNEGKGELVRTSPSENATGFEKFMQPQSPSFTAGMIPYGGIAAEGISNLVKGVPLAGKLLPHVIQGATQMLPVAGSQQLENIANNQPVNLGQFIGTEAMGGGLGAATGIAGNIIPAVKKAFTMGSDLDKNGVPLSSVMNKEPIIAGQTGNTVLPKEQVNAQVPDAPEKPALSRLSDSDANLLNEPITDKDTPFTDYALQAKRALQNKRELTPADVAGQKAVEVLNQIGDLRNTVGAQKGQILKDNAANTINIADVKQSWNDMLKERLGASVDEDGNIIASENGGIVRKPSEIGMIKKINLMIENMPEVVSVQQGDNLKSAINDIVQNQKASQAKPINTVTEGIGKSIGAAIDGKLDESLGPDFAAVNDKYGDLRDIETQLNARLGSIVDPETGTARHGASLMKSAIQSNADRGTKALFQRVKNYTGVDLIKDAGYAEMAMRGVGDSRINNLLTDIGEVKNALHGGIADKAFKIAGAAYNKIKGSPLDEMIDYYNKAQNKAPKPGESAITPKEHPQAQTLENINTPVAPQGVPLSEVQKQAEKPIQAQQTTGTGIASEVELPKKKGVSLGDLFTNQRSGSIGSTGKGAKLSRDAVEPTETYYNPDMEKQAKSNGVSYVGSMKADPEHGIPVDYHYFQDGGMDNGTGSFPVKGSANLKDVLDQHRGTFAKQEKLLDNQRPGSIGSNFKEAQQKSPEFKNWFGDWEKEPEKASKVVDDKGKPLVVYHGTGNDFTTFDNALNKRNTTKIPGEKETNKAFWFAENKSTTEFFANGGVRAPQGVLYHGAKVMENYINVKNPLIVDMKDYARTPGVAETKTMAIRSGKEGRVAGDNGEFKTKKEIYDIGSIKERMVKKAKAEGKDGIIFKNGYDFRPFDGDIYAVFEPNKIKSATGNSGKFDPKNHNSAGSIGSETLHNLAGKNIEKIYGLTPALKDPSTGKIYSSNKGHKFILNNIVSKENPDIQKVLWKSLFNDNVGKYSKDVGYINKFGDFIPRELAEKEASSPKSMIQEFHEGNLGNKNISGTAMLTGMAGASAVGLSIPKIYNMMTRNNQNDKNKPVSLATTIKR
jgi:hypothetical protein